MKILLAIDQSVYSTAAVEMVMERPWPAGTAVRVMSVSLYAYLAMEPWFAPMPEMDALDRDAKKQAEDVVAAAAGRLRGAGLAVETVVREGDPRMLIVDEAESWRADLIVVGSHGYSGIKRLLLGSVSQYVVAHAPCSVEVVRRREG